MTYAALLRMLARVGLPTWQRDSDGKIIGLKSPDGNWTAQTSGVVAPPQSLVISARSQRTLAVNTAYQAIDITKPAILTITLGSPGSLTLTGGTTVVGDIRAGTTAAIANSASGALIAPYKKSLTGSLAVTVNVATDDCETKSFWLAPGEYFAVRLISGAGLAIISTSEQSVG